MQNEDTQSLPPFIKSWKQFYWIVTINLLVMIALFYFFGEYFK